MSNKPTLLGKTLKEIQFIVNEFGMPKYTAIQITNWLYKKRVDDIKNFTDISVNYRAKLIEKFDLGKFSPLKNEKSIDGTVKYLFGLGDKKFIETVFIPDEDKGTLCISSQVGCKMGCLFCMTGKQGFQKNMNAGEIINQISSIEDADKVRNIVFMGMGEPFDNETEVLKSLEILTSEWGFGFSPRRITVSTIGIIPSMINFIENNNCNLAISMHTPFDDERRKLMPIQHVYPISDIINTLKKYDWQGQRRVSFEYIMFKDVNDTKEHLNEIAKLLKGIKCRVNLIKFHSIPSSPLTGSNERRMFEFRDELTKKGVFTTIRKSRGEDILAACGLLSTKEISNKENQN